MEDIDAAVASLVDSMIETMYDAPGTGLAANQVGVQRRIFVYDVGDGPRAVINPRIIESDGEWAYDEGCLSVPGLSWEIVRPNAVHLVGLDLDGNDISIEASELEGRVFQHELDHLDGILLVEHLNEDQRKEALQDLARPHVGSAGVRPRRARQPLHPLTPAPRDVDPHPHPPSAGDRLPYGERVARLAYLGTPDMAVPPLRALVEAGHDVALCVTRPDRRRGRGKEETPSPVKAAATELGIPVSHDMDDLTTAGVELAVVVAYGRIIPARLLEQIPMVNLHFSLLPRWRGAAPVERAILAGDRVTGVCLMKVEEGLDTGPVYAVRTVPARRRHHARRSPSRVGRGGQRTGGGVARPRGRRPARPRAAGGRGHAGGQNQQGGSPPRLDQAGRRAPARRAAGEGVDDLPRQAADRARDLAGPDDPGATQPHPVRSMVPSS